MDEAAGIGVRVTGHIGGAAGRARVAGRWIRILASRPEEAFDRYRTRKVSATEPATGSNEGVSQAWRQLAEVWGQDPDVAISGFDDVWRDLRTRSERWDGVGTRLDGGIEFARCLWVAVRSLRPARVLETGVARGVSSAVLLSALETNGTGRLTSIDLPPLADPHHHASAELVPATLRERWQFVHGDVRRALPQVLVDLGEVDMFIHDSLHTRDHMRFELSLALRFLAPTGVLVADDIHCNDAFDEAVGTDGLGGHLRGRHAEKSGAFGVAWGAKAGMREPSPGAG